MSIGYKTDIPIPSAQVIPSGSNLFKIFFLLATMLASFYLIQRGVEYLQQNGMTHWIIWTSIILAALVNGVLMLGMAALAHDAVHKVLFRSAFWNEFWGGLLSALALIPFHANRQFHLAHHSHAHQPGLDPENEMHNHSFLAAALAGPFIGLFVQYRLFALNILRSSNARFASRAIADAISMFAAGLIYFFLVPTLGMSLQSTVMPMLLLFPAVFTWRALSDHYGIPPLVREPKNRGEISEADEEAWHQESVRRRQEVSGWVVITHPWLEWLWSHVNYHEVHHKYPYLSHQYLPQVFEVTRHQHPYLVVDGYWKSMFNLSRQKYYAAQEDVRPFLTGQNQ